MKAFLLITLFALLLLVVYVRLRPYLQFFRQVLGIFREARKNTTTPGRESALPKKPATSEALLRCAACGAWSPEGQTLKLGAQAFCSHNCLEQRSSRIT